jgi:hypothetical protein
MSDPRIAALAAALDAATYPDVAEGYGFDGDINEFAAAILGEHGVFLPDGYPMDWLVEVREIATLRAALDGLREPLGEWLVEMMERNLTPAEATLYDALRAALAAAKENR